MEDNLDGKQPLRTIEAVLSDVMVSDYQNIQLRIAKATKELEELEDKVKQAKETQRLIQDECDNNLKSTNEAIAVYLKNARLELDKMYSERGSVLSSKENLEKAVSDIKNRQVNESFKISAIRKKVSEEEIKLIETKEQLATINNQIEGKRIELSTLKAESDLRKEISLEKNKLVGENLAVEKKEKELEDQVNKYLVALAEVKSREQKVSTEERLIVGERDKLKNEAEVYDKKKVTLEDIIGTLSTTYQEKISQMKELEKKISQFVKVDNLIIYKKNLEDQATQLIQTIQQSRKEIRSCQDEVETIRKERETHSKEKSFYDKEIGMKKDSLRSVERKIVDAKVEEVSVLNNIAEGKKKIMEDQHLSVVKSEAMRQAINELEEKMTALEQEKLREEVASKKLEARINSLLKESERIEKLILQYQKNQRAIVVELEAKEKELELAKKEATGWQNKSENFSNQLQDIENLKKETDKMYNEVAVMYVRLKPKYLRVFKKFNNLE